RSPDLPQHPRRGAPEAGTAGRGGARVPARPGRRSRPAGSAREPRRYPPSSREVARAITSAVLALDHALQPELHDRLAALVQHAMLVRDDAAIRLLRLALVHDLDLHVDRVAR